MYSIFFHKKGITCAISGEKLKIYVQSDRGGLVIKGAIKRLYYPGTDPVKWALDYTNVTNFKNDNQTVTPTCNEYVTQFNSNYRAKSGELY